MSDDDFDEFDFSFADDLYAKRKEQSENQLQPAHPSSSVQRSANPLPHHGVSLPPASLPSSSSSLPARRQPMLDARSSNAHPSMSQFMPKPSSSPSSASSFSSSMSMLQEKTAIVSHPQMASSSSSAICGQHSLNSGNKFSYLDGLDEDQRRAATADIHRPLLISATAGAGKTRTMMVRIVHMIKEHNVNPREILAITFTRKAAQEMRARIATLLGPEVGPKVIIKTTHAFCLSILTSYENEQRKNKKKKQSSGGEAEEEEDSGELVVYDTKKQKGIIREVLALHDATIPDEQKDQKFASKSKAEQNSYIYKFLQWLSLQKSRGYRPLDFAADTGYGQLFQGYEDMMSEHHALDFQDMIERVVVTLENKASIREKCRWKHRYILVDEFQDMNELQMKLLTLLCPANADAQLTCIGDDDQSIYGWRGAVNVIGRFKEYYASADIMKLERNYRSLSQIVSAGQSLIQANKLRMDKKVYSMLTEDEELDDESKIGRLSQSSSQASQASKKESQGEAEASIFDTTQLPIVASASSTQSEVDWVCKQIAVLLSEKNQRKRVAEGKLRLKLRDIAVLCRTAAPLHEFKVELKSKKIPVSFSASSDGGAVAGSANFIKSKSKASLVEKPVVSIVLDYLNLIVNPKDDGAFRHVYCIPKRNLGDGCLIYLSEFASDIQAMRPAPSSASSSSAAPAARPMRNVSLLQAARMARKAKYPATSRGKRIIQKQQKGLESFLDLLDSMKQHFEETWVSSEAKKERAEDHSDEDDDEDRDGEVDFNGLAAAIQELVDRIGENAFTEHTDAMRRKDEKLAINAKRMAAQRLGAGVNQGRRKKSKPADEIEEFSSDDDWDSDDDEEAMKSYYARDENVQQLIKIAEEFGASMCMFDEEEEDEDGGAHVQHAQKKPEVEEEDDVMILDEPEQHAANAKRRGRGMSLMTLMRSFVSDMATRCQEWEKEEEQEKKDAVTVTTIHQSKGLEWKYVFVVRAVDNVMPSFFRLNEPLAIKDEATVKLRMGELKQDHREEERRLMYVAITRSRARLAISFVKDAPEGMVDDHGELMFAMPPGTSPQKKYSLPSPFLREIPRHQTFQYTIRPSASEEIKQETFGSSSNRSNNNNRYAGPSPRPSYKQEAKQEVPSQGYGRGKSRSYSTNFPMEGPSSSSASASQVRKPAPVMPLRNPLPPLPPPAQKLPPQPQRSQQQQYNQQGRPYSSNFGPPSSACSSSSAAPASSVAHRPYQYQSQPQQDPSSKRPKYEK